MKLAERLKVWSETRAFRIIFGLISLVMAYVFGSFALDSGNLLDYAIAILFVIVGLRELFAGMRR